MKKCRIIATTTNPVKLRAIRKAFSAACTLQELVGMDIGSRLLVKQPRNTKETLCCALERVRIASIAASTNYDFIVSVEAGLFTLPSDIFLEGQVAVIADRKGRLVLGTSPLFPIPLPWIEAILDRGRELEEVASEAVKLKALGESIGVIGVLSRGAVTRQDLTLMAVMHALLPLLNPILYEESFYNLARLYQSLDCTALCANEEAREEGKG